MTGSSASAGSFSALLSASVVGEAALFFFSLSFFFFFFPAPVSLSLAAFSSALPVVVSSALEEGPLRTIEAVVVGGEQSRMLRCSLYLLRLLEQQSQYPAPRILGSSLLVPASFAPAAQRQDVKPKRLTAHPDNK